MDGEAEPRQFGFLFKFFAHGKVTETLALSFLTQWSKTKS